MEDEGRGIGGRLSCEDVGGIYVGICEIFVKEKTRGSYAKILKTVFYLFWMYQSIRLRKFPMSPIKWAGDARGNKARQIASVPFTPDFGGSLYQSFPLFVRNPPLFK